MTAKTILICGAGIGGPALAFWLKAAGFEPTLVERAPTLRSGGFVIDFWGLGYDLAERMEASKRHRETSAITCVNCASSTIAANAWLGLEQECSVS